MLGSSEVLKQLFFSPAQQLKHRHQHLGSVSELKFPFRTLLWHWSPHDVLKKCPCMINTPQDRKVLHFYSCICLISKVTCPVLLRSNDKRWRMKQGQSNNIIYKVFFKSLTFVFTFINSHTLIVKGVKHEDIAQKVVRASFPYPTVHRRDGGKQLSTHKYLNVSLDAVSWED